MEGNTLNFLRKSGESNELTLAYSNSIDGAHIRIGPKEKCPETKAIYYSIVIVLSSGKTRAIFLDSFKLQKEIFEKLLSTQGFKS